MKTSSSLGLTLLAAACLVLAVLWAAPAVALPAASAAVVAAPAPTAPQTEAAGAATAAREQETLIVTDQRGENRCIWLEVTAINLTTGECREFSSPCTVPPGWQITFCEP